MKKQTKSFLAAITLVISIMAGPALWAHCQVPCGIYDDQMRIRMIAEHITTIEKAMNQISKLSMASPVNHNQLVRWVMNKEKHAEELSDILAYYFLAQRLKPVHDDKPKEYKRYQNLLMLTHMMVIHTMKAKQTIDLDQIKHLRNLLKKFEELYFKKGE